MRDLHGDGEEADVEDQEEEHDNRANLEENKSSDS